jgi:glutamate decarboxylase
MISLVGEIITSAVNANMFTYEVAPVFNLMEESILAHMRRCCGWSSDELSSKNGDGVLAPGGAVSNLYAVLAARHYAFPEIKKSGIRDGLRPAMIISKHVKLFENKVSFFFCINCLLFSVIIQ